jgi:uncharacterized protein YjbI with pentapeptide repeats
MAGDRPVPWERCSHNGCVGVQLAAAAWCLAHMAEQDPSAFDAELRRIRDQGTIDARGVQLSAVLLNHILRAAPQEKNRPTFKAARFSGATFEGDAQFDEATFEGDARFSGATFEGDAEFDGATFQGDAEFDKATFQGDARFDGAIFQGAAGFFEATFQGRAGFDKATFHGAAGFMGATFQGGAGFREATFRDMTLFGVATFEDRAWFIKATFEGGAGFDKARFQGDVGFDEATFQGVAVLRGATFQGDAGFTWATFQGKARFQEATFEGGVWFTEARFQGDVGFDKATFQGTAGFFEATFQDEAGFTGASFERATQIGPLLARRLVLDDAVFGARVQLEAVAATVCARRAQFPAGVHLRLRFASVVLDDASLAARAILAGAPSPFPTLAPQEQRVARGWQRLPPGPRAQRWRPRLLSMCRADVAGLRLADVDLRACRFAGAHNLDRLRLEGAPLFARTNGWWRARRKTLAEEQHWRARRPGRWPLAGWYPRACQPPASPKAEAPDVPEPARLAALYRDLRKAREDAKDEPGAADFYYGECEMRRHDPGTPRAERLVLWLYWLLSGYGLRAWRALAALAVVVLLAGIALAFWGFPSASPSFRPAAVDRGGALVYRQQPADPPPGIERLPDSIRFSARSATALLRGPDRPLTPLGEWLEIALRFLGPVLLGLAVLSVRGRVRR